MRQNKMLWRGLIVDVAVAIPSNTFFSYLGYVLSVGVSSWSQRKRVTHKILYELNVIITLISDVYIFPP